MMFPGSMAKHGAGGGYAKGPGRGTLKVTVSEAKNLRNTEMIGKQDPYCVLKFGSETKKTKVHKNGGKQATWNQIFEFDVDEQKMAQWVFQIAVWDKETFSDDLVGRKNFSLQEVLGNHGKGPMQYDIQHKGKNAGSVFMSVEYSGAPKPKPPAPSVAPAVVPAAVGAAYTQQAQPVYTPQTAQPVQTSVYAPQQAQPVYTPQQAQPVYVPQQAQPVYAGQQPGVYGGQPPVYAPQQAQPVYQQAAPVYAGVQPVHVQPVPVQTTAQPVYQQAQPVQTAAVATAAVATGAAVTGMVESKARGINVTKAGTKAINGYYSYKCQNDGVACYSKGGTNYHIMRHTQGSTTAWWVSEWKSGNKNNTVDFYFVESKSKTPPPSGWGIDKYCKGKVPGPKMAMA
mmetsp:Transcript_35737/g.69039  ORF Transcript_35737/g.69039 Transcript_35737/m.69039 type:complete len:398 (-) Transcript_35737:79-1272(-)|eukprot:CAMPEP_0167779274 /NCGR_PEP_ID=MMETSP0111_2-20121227/4718_1 /TAXON_ID=91324 /ORGANISM="Lotharella globosa, Strain CCCM811" /LENGTH=397 /DNA_ID=CAMNT_0007669671 /DNA_START=23 /DNA_END=1219 /DNA_ORIENTATION=-